MVRVAVTGHRPDSFLVSHYDLETIKRVVSDVAVILKREYKDNLIFNLGGAVGIDQWMGQTCIQEEIPYVLYLPFAPSLHTKFWEQKDKDELNRQISCASGIDIVEPNEEAEVMIYNYQKRNERMVDNADFVLAFWVGKRKGGTYNTIKYGLKNAKFVLNGLNELKPIFKEDIKRGWTPKGIY